MSQQNLIVGISGQKGFGKSTYLQELVGDENCLCVIDTLGEHREWCPSCPADDVGEMVEMLAEPPPSFKWSFLLDPTKAEDHLDYLAKAAYRAGDMTFVLEETDYFSSANADCAGVDLLTRYGRHRNINLVWVTRNMAHISRQLTSQTDVFVLFRQSEPLYIETLAKRVSPDVALQVEQLPRYEYIIVPKSEDVSKITRGRTVPK